MATESSYQRIENLPPNYLAQFFSGVPGTNVPGIMPLLNQELVNRMMGFGVQGANPYTYTGQRIADFSPAEREAMRMTAQGMGSYLPYYQSAEAMTRGGLDTATGAYGDTRNLLGEAVQAGELSTGEAMGLLRQAPGVAASATRRGLRQIGRAGRELRGARGVLGGTMGRLGEAAGVGYGATGQFDPRGIESFYNPFEQQVVDQTMEDVRKGLAQSDIARRAGEIGSGAFGGSRSRLQAGELAESAARGAAQQIGAIRSGGYQDAARRAQAAFEAQQARQAGQANLLAGLGAQQADIGSRLGNLGLSAASQNLARGQALGNMQLAGQRAQLGQAGALGQLAGQRAGMGAQIAGLGGNLAGLYGQTAGGIGSLGGNLANIYGGAGRDLFGAGAQLGQLGMGAGSQMAGFGQGVSGLLGQDINRMMGMGGLQRGMDQRALDLAYGNFVGQYNLPMQTFGQIGGMAAGFAPALGGTQLAQGQAGNTTNPLMQGLGTAITAYGAFK